MSDRSDASPVGAAITAEHLGAVIPTALLVALLGRQAALPADPVTVDARSLHIVVPPEAVADLLRGRTPDREISVSFGEGSITVAAPGLPVIRIAIPEDGMRLSVGEDGLRIGGG